jgi:hypothetical protein
MRVGKDAEKVDRELQQRIIATFSYRDEQGWSTTTTQARGSARAETGEIDSEKKGHGRVTPGIPTLSFTAAAECVVTDA